LLFRYRHAAPDAGNAIYQAKPANLGLPPVAGTPFYLMARTINHVMYRISYFCSSQGLSGQRERFSRCNYRDKMPLVIYKPRLVIY